MNLLSIGNSFSQDAQRYLHQIAKADGVELHSYNLYIGGCSLATHHANRKSQQSAYQLEIDGVTTNRMLSLEEALLMQEWDVVTLQQVSHEAIHYETYQPYLNDLTEYVRQMAPKAKLVLHQTWAYAEGSQRLTEELHYSRHQYMLNDLIVAYAKASKEIKADFIIPSGEVFGALLKRGIESLHRDPIHASLGLGRYALGLTWYRFLTGHEILHNTFSEFDQPISPMERELVKQTVLEVAKEYGR